MQLMLLRVSRGLPRTRTKQHLSQLTFQEMGVSRDLSVAHLFELEGQILQSRCLRSYPRLLQRGFVRVYSEHRELGETC